MTIEEEDQLMDEIYGLHCDIGRLENENAILRQQLADVTESMGRVEERCAKLRELVRGMACEYECGYLTLPQWLADRMRELGVEVD